MKLAEHKGDEMQRTNLGVQVQGERGGLGFLRPPMFGRSQYLHMIAVGTDVGRQSYAAND
jgi:hypothetical protein